MRWGSSPLVLGLRSAEGVGSDQCCWDGSCSLPDLLCSSQSGSQESFMDICLALGGGRG